IHRTEAREGAGGRIEFHEPRAVAGADPNRAIGRLSDARRKNYITGINLPQVLDAAFRMIVVEPVEMRVPGGADVKHAGAQRAVGRRGEGRVAAVGDGELAAVAG